MAIPIRDGLQAIAVVTLTPENRPAMLRLALSMYLGERCKFCGKEYKVIEDLSDTVFAGYHKHGRLACKLCWDKQTAEEKRD